jgi:hypothetical protein
VGLQAGVAQHGANDVTKDRVVLDDRDGVAVAREHPRRDGARSVSVAGKRSWFEHACAPQPE